MARKRGNHAAAGPSPDLAGRAMDAIDQVVDVLHDKVVRPLLLVARTVAMGFLIAICLCVLSIVAGIALLRIFDVYVFSAHQWASWLVLGGVALVAGLAIWRFGRAFSSS